MTDDIDNDGTTLHESGGVVQPTDAQIEPTAEAVGMRTALQQIADWRLPSVQIDGVAMSYESAYGSNGARDYMREIARRALSQAPLQAEPVPVVASEPLTDRQIEKLREETFSTTNPFCPVDSKSMRKAVRAAERAHGIKGECK